MRVAIVGGTGFVGGYLIDALLTAGHSVSTLVRAGSDTKLHRSDQVTAIPGELGDTEAIKTLLTDCDAVIYNVGILREHPRQGITFEATQYRGAVEVIDVARNAGVQRLLLMSANGVKTPGTRYQETKFKAEQYAAESGLDVTVFRPSVIFGDPRGTTEIATQLLNDIVRLPVPAINFVMTHGTVEMSPVYVGDVADAFVTALTDAQTIGQHYVLTGPDVMSWREMIETVGEAVGQRKWFLPMPTSLMRLVAILLDWLPVFPVTREQLTMLEEGNVGDAKMMESLIRRSATPFDAQTLGYLTRQ